MYSKATFAQLLQGLAMSEPESSRSESNGPIVYRLGHILLKDRSAVRFRVGSQISTSTRCYTKIL
jgi:hypothetical protein